MAEPIERPDRGRRISRIAGLAILAIAVVAVVVLLFGGDDGYSYRLEFETGGQLVPGNDVAIAGQPIGSVDSITLTDDAQAEVKITVDRPLHEGTTAIVRATSLSGIANRYVSIAPGPDNLPELARRRADRLRHDDLAGRPRPALRHLRRPHAEGAAGGLRGLGDDLRRETRAGARDLQVPRAGPAVDDPAAGRARPRPDGALAASWSAARGRSARSRSRATTSPR